MARAVAACSVAAVALALGARAQSPASALPPNPTAAPPAPCCMATAGTPVEIELTERVSSRTIKAGQTFGIRLARDLKSNGVVLVGAGAMGGGEVIDAAPGGLAGRPGKLVLAARFVDSGSIHLPLRSFRLAGTGRDDSKAAMALTMTPYVGLLAVGIHGGNIEFPAGTHAIARVAADTFIAHPTPDGLPPATASTSRSGANAPISQGERL